MTWSERSEYATLSMLLLPGLAVFPPVTQWHPSTALCHHSLFPLPSCGQDGPGDLLCFLSLGARKLYSGMLWGTSWSFPCTVWYAVTCQMYQSHGSSGWETDLSIWMALLRKQCKETTSQGCSSAHTHHLIADTGWLPGFCPCFTSEDSANHFTAGLPDFVLKRKRNAPPVRWHYNKQDQLRSGLKNHPLLALDW